MNTTPFRRWHVALLICASLVVALSCSGKKSEKNEESSDQAAPVDPDAPAIVIAMIEAHGGMAAWRTATSVSFEDEFITPDSASVVSRVVVDPRKRRAYIDFPGTEQSMAWDGRRADQEGGSIGQLPSGRQPELFGAEALPAVLDAG